MLTVLEMGQFVAVEEKDEVRKRQEPKGHTSHCSFKRMFSVSIGPFGL